MKRLILLFSIELLMLSGLYAQVAYKDSKGRFVIDNAAMLGKSTKTAAEVAVTIDPATKAVVKHFEQDPMNEKVPPKFEVSPVNENTQRVKWSDGASLCIAKDGGEKGWRLPTQRECILIVVMHQQLEALEGFKFDKSTSHRHLIGSTLSSTSSTAGFVMRCTKHGVWTAGEQHMATDGYVRCVRDITD